MGSREDIDKLVQEAYRRRVDQDVAGVCDMFAPEVDFRFAAAPEVQAASFAAAGRPALRPLMERLVRTFPAQGLCPEDRADRRQPCRRALDSSGTSRRLTGHELATDVLDLMEIRDGKIVSFIEFCDTASVERMTAA